MEQQKLLQGSAFFVGFLLGVLEKWVMARGVKKIAWKLVLLQKGQNVQLKLFIFGQNKSIKLTARLLFQSAIIINSFFRISNIFIETKKSKSCFLFSANLQYLVLQLLLLCRCRSWTKKKLEQMILTAWLSAIGTSNFFPANTFEVKSFKAIYFDG